LCAALKAAFRSFKSKGSGELVMMNFAVNHNQGTQIVGGLERLPPQLEISLGMVQREPVVRDQRTLLTDG